MAFRERNLTTRLYVFALAAVLMLPLFAFAQGRGRGNGRGKPSEVFVNGHDARDGRWDGRGPQGRGRDRDRDWDDDDDDWRRRRRNDDRRRRDRDRRDDDYGNGRYGNNNYYGHARQTALNAGYNNGIEEGRKDRQRGERFEYRDEGDYQSATEDYSSRLGIDREQYRAYFRQGFVNGYRAGYNGY